MEKYAIARHNYSETTSKVVKALKDPVYTKEDLQALMIEIEQLLKQIEQSTSLARRLAALFIAFNPRLILPQTTYLSDS
jgi:hypothetical protein